MGKALQKIDADALDNLIFGRVEPFIYAFSTETYPNYLKVGDTSRGVRVRLDEWRTVFPKLVQRYEHTARIDDETMFRDYAVHTFLVVRKDVNVCCRKWSMTRQNIPANFQVHLYGRYRRSDSGYRQKRKRKKRQISSLFDGPAAKNIYLCADSGI